MSAVVAALSAAVAAGPAAPASAAPAVPAPAVATAASATRVVHPHDGQVLVLHRGDSVRLRLTACESCGYTWHITRRPAASVVAYTGRSTTSTACAGCVGGNAAEELGFVAGQLGQTVLRLAYVGPSGAVAKRLAVTFVVIRHPRSVANSSVHTVRTGDTLYRLSRRALGSDATPPRVAFLASRLYRDNRAVIGGNPSFLLPGEVLLVDLTALPACGTTARPTSCNR